MGWSADFPLSVVIGGCTCIQDQPEGNVDILGIHVWLETGTSISEAIFNLFEESFNGILEFYRICHLVLFLCELGGIDETIGGFEMNQDIKG
jgi:hypothetical protein